MNERRIDCHALFNEWVEMNSTQNYWREEQAFIIIRMIESIEFKNLTVVDLGCHAGGLSEYLLKSLKNVKIIGIDSNPFLLMIYRNHLAEYRDKFSLLLGDMREEGTIRKAGHFDAVVSLTSFADLSRQSILGIYRRLYESLPEHGLFANADIITFSNDWFETLHYSAKAKKPIIDINVFWDGIKKKYGIANEIDEMNALTRVGDIPEHGYQPSFYVNSLRWAGFQTVDIVFQAGNRIVYCGKKV